MDGDGHDLLVYCLTRDRELADALETRLSGALAFFYNDAARLHQATVLRRPDIAVVDTRAIKEEYGDAGLSPVVAFLHERAPEARIAVRPTAASEWLGRAEAAAVPGAEVTFLPSARDECVAAVAALLGVT